MSSEETRELVQLFDSPNNATVSKVKALLKKHADPNAKTSEGIPILHFAVENDDLEVTEILLSHGADVWATSDEFNENAALNCPSIEMAKLLLQYGMDESQFDDDPLDANLFPVTIGAWKLSPREISKDAFKEQCNPFRGKENPQETLPDFWYEQIRTNETGYYASGEFGLRNELSPVWSFQRLGRTITPIPDGSLVIIAGEHEDGYDPDFYIYNDVTVISPDAGIRHFVYPYDEFPPTDFHSATLVGDEIYIIGGLRYSQDRVPDETHVYKLQMSDFSIHRVATKGSQPSWLFQHNAVLNQSDGLIVCSGGKVMHTSTGKMVENLTTWQFSIETGQWETLETKEYERWVLAREDNRANDLWGIEKVVNEGKFIQPDKIAQEYRECFAKRGHIVHSNLFRSRFNPPLDHMEIRSDPFSDEYNTTRVLIDDVVVRTVEDRYEIFITVEGELSDEKIQKLKEFGLETYSRLEGVPYKLIEL